VECAPFDSYDKNLLRKKSLQLFVVVGCHNNEINYINYYIVFKNWSINIDSF
jgi:hypothetical protein